MQKATDAWAAVGAQVLKMTPENHDAAFAAVSHLPHMLSFALMHAIVSQPRGQNFLSLAGPGFRDFTRIAASDPKMWRDVLLANRVELVEQAKLFQRSLEQFLQLAEDCQGEKLEALIDQASRTRAQWHMGRKK